MIANCKLFAGGPAVPVEDVLLQRTEEGLHRGVVGAGPDPPHRPAQPVSAQRGEGCVRSKLPGLNRWLQRQLGGATIAARRELRLASSRPALTGPAVDRDLDGKKLVVGPALQVGTLGFCSRLSTEVDSPWSDKDHHCRRKTRLACSSQEAGFDMQEWSRGDSNPCPLDCQSCGSAEVEPHRAPELVYVVVKSPLGHTHGRPWLLSCQGRLVVMAVGEADCDERRIGAGLQRGAMQCELPVSPRQARDRRGPGTEW